MANVFFDNPIVVNFPPSEGMPAGQSVAYEAGWNVIDDQLVNQSPILSRMVQRGDVDQVREQKLREIDADYQREVAEADRKRAHARMELLQGDTQQRDQLSQEWAEKAQQAAEAGRPFNEPHPDPEQAIVIARTAGPMRHAVSAAAMQSEIMDGPTRAANLSRSQERGEPTATGLVTTTGATATGAGSAEETARAEAAKAAADRQTVAPIAGPAAATATGAAKPASDAKAEAKADDKSRPHR